MNNISGIISKQANYTFFPFPAFLFPITFPTQLIFPSSPATVPTAPPAMPESRLPCPKIIDRRALSFPLSFSAGAGEDRVPLPPVKKPSPRGDAGSGGSCDSEEREE